MTKLWADPFVPSGKYPEADLVLRESLRRFLRDCPLEKIFFVQLSDGEKFEPPFSKEHPWYLDSEAPQFTWSRHAPPFPYEAELGAYMPVAEVARAWIVEKGYKGWVSMEVFDRRMRDESCLVEHSAIRGMESWKKLRGELDAALAKI
jgi:sugar phosphate isomerase/epimerase